MEPLGGLLGPLRGVLDRLGGVCGPSWAHLGPSWPSSRPLGGNYRAEAFGGSLLDQIQLKGIQAKSHTGLDPGQLKAVD